MIDGQLRGQIRHASRRLGLPVHHEQVPPLPSAAQGPAANVVGRQLAAGLGEEPQRRPGRVREADPLEQGEGVGHAGQVGHAVVTGAVEEAGVGDRAVAQHHRGPHQQVRVQHRQAIAVVQRQDGHRHVVGGQPEVVGDRGGVGHEVGVRLAHQAGRARRARRRQHQRQVGVGDGGRPMGTELLARERLRQEGGAVWSSRVCQDHGTPGAEARQVVDDGVDRGADRQHVGRSAQFRVAENRPLDLVRQRGVGHRGAPGLDQRRSFAVGPVGAGEDQVGQRRRSDRRWVSGGRRRTSRAALMASVVFPHL